MSAELVEGFKEALDKRYINKKVEHRIDQSNHTVIVYKVYSSIELIQLLLSFKNKLYFLRSDILYHTVEDETKAYTETPPFEVSRSSLVKAARKGFFSFLENKNDGLIEVFIHVKDYGCCVFIG